MSQRSVCSPKFIEHFQTHRHLNGWILDFVNVVYIFSQRTTAKGPSHGPCVCFCSQLRCEGRAPADHLEGSGLVGGLRASCLSFFFTLFMTQAA